MKLVTNEVMKYFEECSNSLGVTYSDLMENAGKNAAAALIEILKNNNINSKNILFVVGTGNNGGDAFVSSRYLADAGYNITIFFSLGETLKTELAKSNFAKIKKTKNISVSRDFEKSLCKNDIIIDAVFGTGFHGTLPENIKTYFKKLAKSKDKLKIAYDIPSGGNGTKGTCDTNTFNADYTLTFGFAKVGLCQYPLKNFVGKTKVIDINFPKNITDKSSEKYFLINKTFAKSHLPKRFAESHKGNFGHLLSITGAESMPGCSILSSYAALKTGVGLLMTAIPKKNIVPTVSKIPESMFLPLKTDEDGFTLFCDKNINLISEKLNWATAVLIGCGIGVTDETKALVTWIIENAKCPVIIDADGLNCIKDNPAILTDAKCGTVITPHPAEFARLCSTSTSLVQQDRTESAVNFAKEYNCITVLKGAGTVVAGKLPNAPDIYCGVNLTGNSGMSKGGSGDVLAGIIASFAAQKNNDLFNMACLGVYIHGLSGDIAAEKNTMISMLPCDIIENLPDAFKYIQK